jgi:hypothetical protein
MVSDSLAKYAFDNVRVLNKCVTVGHCSFELDGAVPNNGGVN